MAFGEAKKKRDRWGQSWLHTLSHDLVLLDTTDKEEENLPMMSNVTSCVFCLNFPPIYKCKQTTHKVVCS